jgi:hypothetical protein
VKQHGPSRHAAHSCCRLWRRCFSTWIGGPRPAGMEPQWCIDHDVRPSVALRSGEGANVGETAGVSDEVAPRSGGSSLHKRRNGDRHGAGPTRRNGA